MLNKLRFNDSLGISKDKLWGYMRSDNRNN